MMKFRRRKLGPTSEDMTINKHRVIWTIWIVRTSQVHGCLLKSVCVALSSLPLAEGSPEDCKTKVKNGLL